MWYKAKTSTNKPQWQMMYDGDVIFYIWWCYQKSISDLWNMYQAHD